MGCEIVLIVEDDDAVRDLASRALDRLGYAEDVIVKRGVLDDGLMFIGKPYTPQSLGLKVRQILDET